MGARRTAGLTLVELMVVVAIIGVLMLVVGASIARQDNDAAVNRFGYKVLVAMRQARNTAMSSGAVVQIWFRSDGKQFSVVRSSLPGSTASGSWIQLKEEQSARAQVVAIRSGSEMGVVNNPGTGGLAAGSPPEGKLTFYPNGTADAVTVYLRDDTEVYKQKVVLFPAAAYSERVTRW